MAVASTRMDRNAAGFRRAAARSRDADAAPRMLALALVLGGHSRAEAAVLGGMDRQTLRDWVHRFDEFGLDGLSSRIPADPKPRLTPAQEAEVAAMVRAGPSPAEHGVLRWRRVDRSRVIEDGSAFVWRSAASAIGCDVSASGASQRDHATSVTMPKSRTRTHGAKITAGSSALPSGTAITSHARSIRRDRLSVAQAESSPQCYPGASANARATSHREPFHFQRAWISQWPRNAATRARRRLRAAEGSLPRRS